MTNEKEYYVVDLDRTVSPIFHPTQDFLDGHLSYGILVPASNSKGQAENKLAIVSDDKQLWLLDDLLEEKKVKTVVDPPLQPGLWRIESLKSWLKADKKLENKGLLKKIADTYRNFLGLRYPGSYELLAAWVIGSYFFMAFDSYPYAIFGGFKGTGKTKSLKCMAYTAFNGRIELNPSGATIHRLVSDLRPSIAFDEFEYMSEDVRASVYQLLRSGYKQGGLVSRYAKGKGERMKLEELPVYSPKAFASTWELNEFEERGIKFINIKAEEGEFLDREPRQKDFTEIRDECYQFGLDNWREILEIYDGLKNETKMDSRSWELWKPIFAIGIYFGEEYRELFKELAKKVEESRTEDKKASIEGIISDAIKRYKENNPEAKYLTIQSLVELISPEDQAVFGERWQKPGALHTYLGLKMRSCGFKRKEERGISGKERRWYFDD